MAERDLPNSGAVEADLLIVGAGLSGVGMAATMMDKSPQTSFLIAERRTDIGGTWDLFRYPGIRSDSDMHTLGFEFEPWREDRAIAGAGAILSYINRTVDQRGFRDRIMLGQKVISADWDGDEARWRVVLEDEREERQLIKARFLHLGVGYYDYDEPHDALLTGRERFEGQMIHPQFWPGNLDYSGKRIVVIGSGATAVTLVPAMAETAAQVTMLQRTPTWMVVRPSVDRIANLLRKALPARLAYALTRFKNTRFQDWIFRRMRRHPEQAKAYLLKQIEAELGDRFEPADFTAPYAPWDQRICLVPDGDLFSAIKAGKAEIVTDHIETIEEHGVLLKSGRRLPADIIVTATGLKMALGGKIALSVNGVPLDLSHHYFYKSCMLSNIPNLSVSLGYFNASFTLRLSLVADYVARLLNTMRERGAEIAVPVMLPGTEPPAAAPFAMTSGYLQRAQGIMPMSAASLPWRLEPDYLTECKWMKSSPISDEIIAFERASCQRAR